YRVLKDKKEIQMLLLLPGLLLSQWLVFRKRKSFLHNSYFALYSVAHSTLLLQVFAPVYLISHTLFMYLYIGLGAIFPIVYNVYAGVNFYAPDWRVLVVRNEIGRAHV